MNYTIKYFYGFIKGFNKNEYSDMYVSFQAA